MGEAGPHRQWLRLNTVSEASRHSAFNFAILILTAHGVAVLATCPVPKLLF